MNDERQDPLAERFDLARQQIEREVDGPAGLDRLYNRRSRSSRLLGAGLAAALVLVVAAGAFWASARSSDDVVADGPEETTTVDEIVEGTVGGVDWSVVEYVESDPRFVDAPESCLRIEPRIEAGPFFCEARGFSGNYGRLVDRSGRLGGLKVFVGVFAPEVAQLYFGIGGERQLVDTTAWGDDGLRVAVVLKDVPDELGYDVDLLNDSGELLSRQSYEGSGN